MEGQAALPHLSLPHGGQLLIGGNVPTQGGGGQAVDWQVARGVPRRLLRLLGLGCVAVAALAGNTTTTAALAAAHARCLWSWTAGRSRGALGGRRHTPLLRLCLRLPASTLAPPLA